MERCSTPSWLHVQYQILDLLTAEAVRLIDGASPSVHGVIIALVFFVLGIDDVFDLTLFLHVRTGFRVVDIKIHVGRVVPIHERSRWLIVESFGGLQVCGRLGGLTRLNRRNILAVTLAGGDIVARILRQLIEPTLDDMDYCACLELVLLQLMARRM